MKINKNLFFSFFSEMKNFGKRKLEGIHIPSFSVFSSSLFRNPDIFSKIGFGRPLSEIFRKTKSIDNRTIPTPPLTKTTNHETQQEELLRKELLREVPEGEKPLLQYVNYAELQKIHACYDHPRQKELVDYIRSGNWEGLISTYQNERDTLPVHAIIKAAYLQRRIDSIDDLVTAYIFLSPAVSQLPYVLHRFDSAIDEADRPDLAYYRKAIDTVSPNQRFFLSIRIADLDPSMQLLMRSFDRKDCPEGMPGGVRYSSRKEFGIVSSALLRKHPASLRHPPVFISGITPNRIDIYDRLEQGLSDFALLDPQHTDLIHGVRPQGFFCYLHDGFHLWMRDRTGILHRPELLRFGRRLERLLDTIPPYPDPDAIQMKDTAYPFIAKTSAIRKNGARFIIESVSGILLDGEIASLSDPNMKNKEILEYAFNEACLRMVPPNLIQLYLHERCFAEVNRYLETMGIELYSSWGTVKVFGSEEEIFKK